jgi:hypothetical protein
MVAACHERCPKGKTVRKSSKDSRHDFFTGSQSHVETLGEVVDRGAAAQKDAKSVDHSRRETGEVGESSLAHLAALAVGLAQEDAGFGAAVGDGLDVQDYVLL